MEQNKLTLGSLFDGSGGFPLGGLISGIAPVWASEIEPFPIMVTKKRLPFMKHYGDVSLMDGGEVEPVDIITFGSPCQDMSIAGKREGLGGNRSGLFYEAVRIVKEMRVKTIGYEEETSPTLCAGVVPATVYENHGQDTRYTGPIDTAPTVSATYGTGGNNQPFVVETPKTLKIRSGCEGGGKGALIQDDKSATLGTHNDQTLFQPKVYGICSKDSNAMKSANPHSGFYEATTSRTLDGKGGNPSCNQGGIVVVEGNGSRPSHHGDGYKEDDVMYTLNATEEHAVAYGIDRAAFNQGQNAKFGFAVETEVEPTIVAKGPGAVAEPTYFSSRTSFFTEATEELASTLMATDYKDPPLINDKDEAEYIVRRLTPTECARLQGFPDWWCADLCEENPTDDEIAFWRDVFETHRKVVTHAKKPKTDKQIRKWLTNPYSDSAAYKLWGNGVALPCVHFVLAGIVYYSQFTLSDREKEIVDGLNQGAN